MENVFINALGRVCLEDQPLEICERKGLGHPDTICDTVMNTISVELSKEYMKRFDVVLHHNVDKSLLAAGKTIPMFKGGTPWATLEVRFRGIEEIGPTGLLGALWERPLIRLVGLVGVLGFATYLVYMRRTLRHLDPSAVIPTRVQAGGGPKTPTGVFLLRIGTTRNCWAFLLFAPARPATGGTARPGRESAGV